MDQATKKLYNSISIATWPACPRSLNDLETASPVNAMWILLFGIGRDHKLLLVHGQLPDVRDADSLLVLADLGDVLLGTKEGSNSS